MVLKNFPIIFHASTGYTGPVLMNGSNFSGSGWVGLITYTHSAQSNVHFKGNGSSGSYVGIGSGTTAATINDYKFSDNNDLINGNSLSVVSSVENLYVNDNKMYSIKTSYQNVSDSPITVNEVGLCQKCSSSSGAGSSIMLTHTVLTTPVVIAPGEIYAFTVTITV